jgi:hypothetical protein
LVQRGQHAAPTKGEAKQVGIHRSPAGDPLTARR